MAIVGVGIDAVKIKRIKKIHERFGEAFAKRILMPQEFDDYLKQARPVHFLARRFAAKEAIVKSFGTGFDGVYLRDIGVINNTLGKPCVICSARGESHAASLNIKIIHVSVSDEKKWVIATATSEN